MNTEDEEFERIEREIVRRALPDPIHHADTSESLEYITGWNDCRQAMLVEQPAQPAQQEPDWGALAEKRLASLKTDMRVSLEDAAVRATHKMMAEIEQEPVAWMQNTTAGLYVIDHYDEWHCIPLYTSPQPAQRKPLTDEKIWKLAANCLDSVAGRMQFARAIEAAHGIKE